MKQLGLNLEAEYAYLGCILTKGDLIKESTLEAHHFYDPTNRRIFQAMKKIEVANEPIDVVTVVTKIGNEHLNQIGGRAHLTTLMNSVPSIEPCKTYEKYIVEAWKLWEANKIQQADISTVEDIDLVVDLYQTINDQSLGISGLDTGLRDLNKYLDGFQKKELIVSAARPSVGKTAKMLSHAITHCLNGGMTAIFSLEMDKDSLLKRMIASIGRVNGFKLKNPKKYFNDEDWEKFTKAIGILSNMNIFIYDQAGQTVSSIRAKVNQLKRKYPDVPLLVQVDYLQLIRPVGRRETRTVEIGEITSGLKGLAKDADVPVYLVSQLSRQDKRPRMSDIRNSGNVEQDADVIEFLYRDDYYDEESERLITVSVFYHVCHLLYQCLTNNLPRDAKLLYHTRKGSLYLT